MNSGNPLWDYIDHLKSLKLQPETQPETQTCESCKEKFCPELQPGGMKLDGENEFYCPDCVKFSNHVAYICNYAPSKEQAMFIIDQLKNL